jgi:fatty acid desaturase
MVGAQQARSEDSTRQIGSELMVVFRRLRERHAFLRHQDAIGAAIFALGAGAIVLGAVLYVRGVLPAWAAVPLAAFFMSILHELEHDLIHRLYFKRQPLLQDAMMLGVWLFRPSTVNPWLRRDWHLNHHKVSGTDGDFEERAITNGEPWGLRRLLMTADGVLAVALRPATIYRMTRAYLRARDARTPAARMSIVRSMRLAYVPLGLVHFALWYAFLALHGVALVRSFAGTGLGAPSPAPSAAMHALDVSVVVWLMPNVLRSFCLNMVSSNLHYFGDVDPRDTRRQTQVWTAWWVWPLQIFCFNFGGTHAIHHFVVQEPFYVRQLVAAEAHVVLRSHGVRFNDFATFLRANRWTGPSAAALQGREQAPSVDTAAAVSA